MPMQTLKEIANELARTQPGMVDAMTEDAPIIADVKWSAATHGMWNAAEKVSDISGPGFVDANAPLPAMGVTSDIVQTHVSIMGGELEVSVQTADRFGGPAQYFARRQDPLLRQAGMDTEKRLYYDYWMSGAKKESNFQSAGGSAADSGDTGLSSLMVVRYDQDYNVGIFDPKQFAQGRLLNISPINGGNKYHLRTMTNVLGYGVAYEGRFGWQMLAPEKTVFGIVNIADGHLPTAAMLDDAVAMVRGTPSNTRIFCHYRTAAKVFGPLKYNKLDVSNTDKGINTVVDNWNGIPIIRSYNLIYGNESAVA